MFYVFLCCSVCWSLYGPFCHAALKIDISLNISSIYICNTIKRRRCITSSDKLRDQTLVPSVTAFVWTGKHWHCFGIQEPFTYLFLIKVAICMRSRSAIVFLQLSPAESLQPQSTISQQKKAVLPWAVASVYIY